MLAPDAMSGETDADEGHESESNAPGHAGPRPSCKHAGASIKRPSAAAGSRFHLLVPAASPPGCVNCCLRGSRKLFFFSLCRRRSAARSQAVLKRGRNLPCGKQAFGFRWTRFVGGAVQIRFSGTKRSSQRGLDIPLVSADINTTSTTFPPPTHLGVVTQDGRRRQGARSAPGDLPLSESQTWTNRHDKNKKVKQPPGRQTSRIVFRSAHRPPPRSVCARRAVPAGTCSAQTSFFVVSVSIERSTHLQSQVSPRMIEQGLGVAIVVMQGAGIA